MVFTHWTSSDVDATGATAWSAWSISSAVAKRDCGRVARARDTIGSIFRLLKIVSAFTVAHTITLVLATLRIVNPSPRIVEPAIALSIVYIGFETLRSLRHQGDARARIAFGFGLIHGFGFASVLRDFGLPSAALGWALGSFNVGVELGQACIVLAVAPILMWVRRLSPVAGRRLVTAMSGVIIAAGAFWFVQRLFAA